MKLNESKLKQIVSESVKKVLKESESTYSLQRIISREIDDAARTLSLCQSDDEVVNITKRLIKMLHGILISHDRNNYEL